MNDSDMGGPQRILLMERDTSVRDLINEVLVDAEYAVVMRGHPLDSADVSKLQPDLIILDIPKATTSPELDFLSDLKSDAHTAHIPILALCRAFPSNDVTAWTREKGIAGLLRKPFDLDEFLGEVQSAIARADTSALAARHDTSVRHMDHGSTPPSA